MRSVLTCVVFDELVTQSVGDRIRYDCAVDTIDYRNQGVVVTSSTGETFDADNVLVFAPIIMLQRGAT